MKLYIFLGQVGHNMSHWDVFCPGTFLHERGIEFERLD
jgi:hypothetical protein